MVVFVGFGVWGFPIWCLGGGSGVQGVRGIGRVCRFRGLGVSDLVFGGGVQGFRGSGVYRALFASCFWVSGFRVVGFG